MQLTIERLVYGGDGLARLPADERGRGKAVFVPFVLPGERVEASLAEEKPGFARAGVDRLLAASPRRIEPHCPYFQRCGGCHYQHASYEHQLEIKAAILKENLRRIAKIELNTELKVHASPPWNYRNRTRFQVRTEPGFELGYYKFGSHQLLPIEECPISSPLINRAIPQFWELGRSGNVPVGVRELEFFANAEDSELLVEVHCERGTPTKVMKQWAEELRLSQPYILGVALSKRAATPAPVEPVALAGTGQLSYRTASGMYRVSAGSFFQVNRHLTDQLIGVVTEGQSGGTALDLYAGVGLFTVVLSWEFQRVISVESSQSSAQDLTYNAPQNVKIVHATTQAYVENVAGKLKPDLVVADPPRSGLGEKLSQSLARLGAPRLTYVSCDPATLARDLNHLLAGGYRVEQAHLVDLFPQTYHVESVVQLVR